MRSDHLELHLKHERTNWWFTARERILCDIVEREILGRDPGTVVEPGRSAAAKHERVLIDIGCGGGGFVEALGRYGLAYGIDASPDAVQFASARGVDVRLGSLPDQIPVTEGSAAVIALLDVIEHIDDDHGAMSQVYRLLQPGGHVLITVPAYDFLWSYHDTVNGHKRRYTLGTLRRLIEGVGFDIQRISYFNSVLFPPIASVRLMRRLVGSREKADSPIVPGPVNVILEQVFAAERWLLRWGSLPFGVSIVAVASKSAAAAHLDNAPVSPGASHV